jgi:hypothetical protein
MATKKVMSWTIINLALTQEERVYGVRLVSLATYGPLTMVVLTASDGLIAHKTAVGKAAESLRARALLNLKNLRVNTKRRAKATESVEC